MKLNMKNVVAPVAIAALVSVPVMAATSGSLLLQGSVAQVLSVVVTPEDGVHNNLDLSASPNDLKVASVNEKSNSSTGYKIFVRSDNEGELKNGEFASVVYDLSYDGAKVDFKKPTDAVKVVSTGGVITDDSDIAISYVGSPAESLPSGQYSDTVTIEIQAN
jgi:hypothetical protein